MSRLRRVKIAGRWVDAEPRDGKRDGAFCMSMQADESRILMNFSGSFNSVQTLAHELGHAYHNVNLADRTALGEQQHPGPDPEVAAEHDRDERQWPAKREHGRPPHVAGRRGYALHVALHDRAV